MSTLQKSKNSPSTDTRPPGIEASDKVILFDGVCKLCNAWSQFIIQHDRRHIFKLCSVQSEEGQRILHFFGFSTDFFDTMLYVEGAKCFQRSDAFFEVMSQLGFPWIVIGVFRFLPKALRDWLYDRIALNRYRLFGKYDYCMLPSPDHEARFLDAGK